MRLNLTTVTVNPYWLQFDRPPLGVEIILAIVVLAIAILSILGNTVVVIHYGKKKLPKGIERYLVSLALSDLFSPLCTYWMMAASAVNGYWWFSNKSCELYGFFQGYCSFISINTVTAIGLERYLAIKRPFGAYTSNLRRKQFASLTAIWVWSAVLAAPPLFNWSHYTPDGYLYSCCFEFIYRDWTTRSFLVTLTILGFFLPVTVICKCYTGILMEIRHSKLRKQSNTKYGATNCDQQTLSHSCKNAAKTIEHQIVRTMLLVISLFVVSWTPYVIVVFVAQFGPANSVGPVLVTVASLIAKQATIYNPLIYAVTDKEFRKAIFPFWKNKSEQHYQASFPAERLMAAANEQL